MHILIEFSVSEIVGQEEESVLQSVEQIIKFARTKLRVIRIERVEIS